MRRRRRNAFAASRESDTSWRLLSYSSHDQLVLTREANTPIYSQKFVEKASKDEDN